MTATPPRLVGNGAARAGRCTDGSVPSTNRATVITAPVLPALTSPLASPRCTRRAATCAELSFFLRNACVGESLMAITSLAGTTSIERPRCLWRANSRLTSAGCPTSRMRVPSSRAARMDPSTSVRGAASPPIASTAIVIIGSLPANLLRARRTRTRALDEPHSPKTNQI